MGGLKLYLSNMFYVHGQAGAGFGANGLGTSFWYGAGIGFNLSKAIDAEIKYTGWKQHLVTMSTGGGTYGGTNGGTTGGTGTYGSGGSTTGTGSSGTGTGTGTSTGTGGYGGHYPTIGLRLAYNF